MKLIFKLAVVVFLVVVLWSVVLWSVVLPALWKPLTEPGPNQDECPPGGSHLSATDDTASGLVRVIRLTDDGEFANHCELTDTTYAIRNHKGPELIVWYVHGWKHNADKDDSDVRHFKQLITELDKQQSKLGEGNRRKVVGVYVGWDGAVGPCPLRHLTFWNRKRAADRISQSSILTKIIAATKWARKQGLPGTESKEWKEITARDVTVMIGHSFGARILYTATSQVLIDEVQRRHPGAAKYCYDVIQGPADLILLLNPAFEASVFTAMHSVGRPSKPWECIDRGQTPLLLVLASENDWPNRTAFPWGQWLDFARRDRQLATLGNYKEYVTHSLQRIKSSDASPRETFWYDDFEAAGLRLLRTTVRQPGTPFIVAQTTSDIIDGHNRIWEDDLRGWIVRFLQTLQERRPSPALEGQ
jgi:hypothetical protein